MGEVWRAHQRDVGEHTTYYSVKAYDAETLELVRVIFTSSDIDCTSEIIQEVASDHNRISELEAELTPERIAEPDYLKLTLEKWGVEFQMAKNRNMTTVDLEEKQRVFLALEEAKFMQGIAETGMSYANDVADQMQQHDEAAEQRATQLEAAHKGMAVENLELQDKVTALQRRVNELENDGEYDQLVDAYTERREEVKVLQQRIEKALIVAEDLANDGCTYLPTDVISLLKGE